MLHASMAKSNLINRSISLARVLLFGVHWQRGVFIALGLLWALVYLVDYVSKSAQVVAGVMAVPVLLQILVGMHIAMRVSQLLMSSQLHLVGMRKEIFFNCFILCLIFTALVYDPKNSDNLINAKLIMFAFFSVTSCWLCWIYCLQIIPMIIAFILGVSAIGFSFAIGVKAAFLTFNIVLWTYFAFWLWRSPLQRQFKYENFSGLVDYCVDRLKIVSLKSALTKVNNKDHVLLMGEGDGYFNRLILASIFSLVFTLFYVVFMRDMRELCLWMILLFLNGTKAKLKITQSHAKLWLLSSSDRVGQFKTTENILLRLNLYSFFMASLLLILWIAANPAFLVDGVAAMCLSFLITVAVDYSSGLIMPRGKATLLVLVFAKMALMSAMAFMHFNILWYLLIAIALLVLCLLFRKRAQRDFLVANLSVRAS